MHRRTLHFILDTLKTFTENWVNKQRFLVLILTKIFFRNKTFWFFKIESWNFQNMFEKEFSDISQNLNSFSSFSSFRQFLFPYFFYQLSNWVEILWGFTKFFFKLSLRFSAFYLEKQKSFIPKKNKNQNKKALFTDPIFSEGFGYPFKVVSWVTGGDFRLGIQRL